MSDSHGRVINFGAGPSALPLSVLEEAQKGLLNFNGTGIGIAEVSHRSKEFTAFVDQFEKNIRTLLDVPPTHRILFTQGGGTAQFSAVVLNLLARHRLLNPNATPEETTLDYVVTGGWSKKAAEEARRLAAGHATVRTVVDSKVYSKDGKSYDNIPPHAEFEFSANPALICYCENETVDGVEFSHDAQSPASFPFHLLKTDGALVPLVADITDKASIAALADAVAAREGALDVLVNNAGVVDQRARLDEMDMARWRRMFDINVIGSLLWVGLCVFAGYLFGGFEFVKNNFSLVVLAIIVISILPAAIEFLRHWAKRPRSGAASSHEKTESAS